MTLFAQSSGLIIGSAPFQKRNVFKMRQASLPLFLWEWHLDKRVVYLVDGETGKRLGANGGWFNGRVTMHRGSDAITHLAYSRRPEFRWEWHSGKQIVYLIDIAMGERLGRVEGNAIAFNIDSKARAEQVVRIWCCGYVAGRDAKYRSDIASNIDTEGGAWNAVLIWCRGYKAAKFATSHNDSGKLVLLGDHQ